MMKLQTVIPAALLWAITPTEPDTVAIIRDIYNTYSAKPGASAVIVHMQRQDVRYYQGYVNYRDVSGRAHFVPCDAAYLNARVFRWSCPPMGR